MEAPGQNTQVLEGHEGQRFLPTFCPYTGWPLTLPPPPSAQAVAEGEDEHKRGLLKMSVYLYFYPLHPPSICSSVTANREREAFTIPRVPILFSSTIRTIHQTNRIQH
jgi:hypothetical protein